MSRAIKRTQKPDTTENQVNVTDVIEKYKQREKNLFPLRINRQTVIYVKKEKQTAEYADWYRQNRMQRL